MPIIMLAFVYATAFHSKREHHPQLMEKDLSKAQVRLDEKKMFGKPMC